MTAAPTSQDDAVFLRQLADRLDPDIPWADTQVSDVDVSENLRRIAAHLDRIGAASDRPAPDA